MLQEELACANWSLSLAHSRASECGISLTERHCHMIDVLRQLYFKENRHPSTRVLMKALQAENQASTMLELMRLFGEQPLRSLSYIAGLPKPPHCI